MSNKRAARVLLEDADRLLMRSAGLVFVKAWKAPYRAFPAQEATHDV
jgi:hypothetical protein